MADEAIAVKDITLTAFGLVIAYLLPGVFALFTASFWFPPVLDLLTAFRTSDSSGGLFFVVVLYALTLGLHLTGIRWLLFESWQGKNRKLSAAGFVQLSADGALPAWHATLDENFRYHQFWGGSVPVIPFFFLGLARSQSVTMWTWHGLGWLIAFVVVQIVAVAEALESLNRYVARTKAILERSK